MRRTATGPALTTGRRRNERLVDHPGQRTTRERPSKLGERHHSLFTSARPRRTEGCFFGLHAIARPSRVWALTSAFVTGDGRSRLAQRRHSTTGTSDRGDRLRHAAAVSLRAAGSCFAPPIQWVPPLEPGSPAALLLPCGVGPLLPAVSTHAADDSLATRAIVPARTRFMAGRASSRSRQRSPYARNSARTRP